MRPATAVTKKSQSSTRSIWKKYENLKPQKNQFYCFKTITQILQAHQTKTFKDQKKQFYYHKINSPRKQLKENVACKDNLQKKMSTFIDRNPTMKKTLSNNFFSTKQIGKENTDHSNIIKMKTQNKIDNQIKFLPYRQQAISIIKMSKILNETENLSKKQYDLGNIRLDSAKCNQRNTKKNMKVKPKQKIRHGGEYSLTPNELGDRINQEQNQFAIQQWDNFQQDAGTFSMLINTKFH